MISAKPEPGKDVLFSVGSMNFCLGFQQDERVLAISYQLSASANDWTWIAKITIPDNSGSLTLKKWCEWLAVDLPKLQAAFNKWLANILPANPTEPVPSITGEAGLFWLVKNRLKVDASGNITLDTTGI